MNESLREALIERYTKMLTLIDQANSEGYAGDNALESGYTLTAEQHYRSSQTYRKRADNMRAKIATLLEPHNAKKTESLRTEAEAEARKQLYGSGEVSSHPFVD